MPASHYRLILYELTYIMITRMKSQEKSPRFGEKIRKNLRQILLLGILVTSVSLPATLWLAGTCALDKDRENTQTGGMVCSSLPNSQRLALVIGREPVPNRFVFSIEAIIESANPPYPVKKFRQMMFSQTGDFPWFSTHYRSFDYPSN